MKRLYLCGAGNSEGVRLALNVNQALRRWDEIIVLDDDPRKHGQLLLGIKIAGPFEMLGDADPAVDEVSNLVARTTRGRESARRKIERFGLPFAPLVDPGVDTAWVEYGKDIIVYRNASLCANAFLDEGSVVFGGAMAGHGSHLGRYCILAPGAVVNARVELGEGAYLGANASILPDLKVGSWATIAANSLVIQDVPAGATVMGVPAQIVVPGESASSDESPGGTALKPHDSLRPADFGNATSEQPGIQTDALRRLRNAKEKWAESYLLKNQEGRS